MIFWLINHDSSFKHCVVFTKNYQRKSLLNNKTIIFVAMPDSIHTARWLEQLNEQGWDIHLFPSTLIAALHPRIRQVTVHHIFHKKRILDTDSPKHSVIKLFERTFYAVLRRGFAKLSLYWRTKQLAKLIACVQPDIVHSLEIQNAGYLTLAAKTQLKNQFPTWIVTNWGSDIYLFGKIPQHQNKIKQVLAQCDYYACECERDVTLARDYGFNKTVLPVFPNTGGFDLSSLANIRGQLLTAKRKIIMLKGYQHFAGRALIGLQALAACADVLQGYTVVIYSASKQVIKEAKLLTEQTAIAVKIVPHATSHDDILAFHAQARISIGLSISDAISTSLLEAMVMGSFPIQSCTACADEWIEHGVSGAIVPAEQPEIIAMWIRKTLSDDELVNRAAQINWQTALARLDGEALKQQAIAIYNTVELS